MAELIASGKTENVSSDFTLTSGVSTTLHIKTADGKIPKDAYVAIELKGGTGYTAIGGLTDEAPALVLAAPGTYRVRRLANTVDFGVERD